MPGGNDGVLQVGTGSHLEFKSIGQGFSPLLVDTSPILLLTVSTQLLHPFKLSKNGSFFLTIPNFVNVPFANKICDCYYSVGILMSIQIFKE